jgi:hypothetical protein
MSPDTMAALAFAVTLGSARKQGMPEAHAQLAALTMAYVAVLAFAIGGSS